MSETPKVGDRVRVTYEGTVSVADGSVRVSVGDYFNEWAPIDATIEVLQPADGLETDLVGTVRENTGCYGGVYVKVHANLADYESSAWLHPAGGFFGTLDTVGPIVGAVPGTPAAEAQKPREPRVFDEGSEVPEDVTAVRTRDGYNAFRVRSGWRYGTDRADAESNGEYGWYQFSSYEYPVTEVFE
jgi:hypothetical protein